MKSVAKGQCDSRACTPDPYTTPIPWHVLHMVPKISIAQDPLFLIYSDQSCFLRLLMEVGLQMK